MAIEKEYDKVLRFGNLKYLFNNLILFVAWKIYWQWPTQFANNINFSLFNFLGYFEANC